MKEKLFLKNKNGAFAAKFSRPSTSKITLVLCHGLGSNMSNPINRDLEKEFNKNNIATLRIDFFGHGLSAGKFEEITASKAVENILSATLFLENQGFNNIGLVGPSFGGFSCLLAASKVQKYFMLVLISPVIDYLEREKELYPGRLATWREKGHKLFGRRGSKINFSFAEDFIQINGYEEAKKLELPVLIVHGDMDRQVPILQSEKASTIISNCTFKKIVGANHYFSDNEHRKIMLDEVEEFVLSQVSLLN